MNTSAPPALSLTRNHHPTPSTPQVRPECFMGWYHSHPFDVGAHSNAFLSATDVFTQLSWQMPEDRAGNPWLALVVRARCDAAGIRAMRALSGAHGLPALSHVAVASRFKPTVMTLMRDDRRVLPALATNGHNLPLYRVPMCPLHYARESTHSHPSLQSIAHTCTQLHTHWHLATIDGTYPHIHSQNHSHPRRTFAPACLQVDPLRSVAKGRPEIGAFRCYPPDHSPPVGMAPDGVMWTDERARNARWGESCVSYYELEVRGGWGNAEEWGRQLGRVSVSEHTAPCFVP